MWAVNKKASKSMKQNNQTERKKDKSTTIVGDFNIRLL